MAANYYSKSLVAGVSVTTLAINKDFNQLAITNDSPSGILYVSFEQDIASDYVPIFPFQELNLDISITNLYYKSSVENVSFRLFGLI